MAATDIQGTAAEGKLVAPFSKAWCVRAIDMWEGDVLPALVDPSSCDFVLELGAIDADGVSQLEAHNGRILSWEPGKKLMDDDCDFIIWATSENWRRIAEGRLEPAAAMASRRVHLRKGLLSVGTREFDAITQMLVGFGGIPTAW